jgi:hypothetical protein
MNLTAKVGFAMDDRNNNQQYIGIHTHWSVIILYQTYWYAL